MIAISTIGFTKTTAEAFFNAIRSSGARRLIDVRLNNVSQLAGFAKRDDLRYFLRELCSADYQHELLLAPTKDLLDRYRARQLSWAEYERGFLELLEQRHVEEVFSPDLLDGSVLLCSEASPHRCHRRLVADYLAERWADVIVTHL